MNTKLNLSGVNGSPFQSHYIPCDKPYKVYVFVDNWETRIAQQIGTMVIVKQNENGEITYEYKPGFRFDDSPIYHTSERVVFTDDDDWFSDEDYLGTVGDTVGMYEVCVVLNKEARFGYSIMMPQEAIEMMERSGLKVDIKKDLPKDGILRDLSVAISNNHGGYEGDEEKDSRIITIEFKRNQIAIAGARINSNDYDGVVHLARLFNAWKKLGVVDFEIKVDTLMERMYGDEIKEFVSLAKQYSLHQQQFPNSKHYKIISCSKGVNGEDCTIEDFVNAWNREIKKMFNFDHELLKDRREDIIKELEEAEQEGLLKLEGEKIKLSSLLSRIGKLKFREY